MGDITLRSILDLKLIEVGDTTVTMATAVSALIIILFTLWLSKLARRGVTRVLRARGIDHERSTGTLTSLLHYLILVTGFGVALDTIGIDLAALFAAGAIFAIGLGFAMQNIAQNFVSGVILLMERAIKPGDVIGVEDMVCRVVRMGIRATIVQTRDGEDLIVPNSILAQSTVKNYTLDQANYRLRAVVGVVYGATMSEVRATLERVAHDIDWREADHEPQVLMLEFGDNSVNWEVAIWIRDPWRARVRLSALNEAIWDAFHEKGITIAFPQLDVHFDPEVTEGFAGLRKAS